MLQKQFYSTVFILLLAALFWRSDYAQDFQKPKGDLLTLDKYDLVARGKMSQSRGVRPVQIAQMDSNGEILIACTKAKTAEELLKNC